METALALKWVVSERSPATAVSGGTSAPDAGA